MGFLDKKTCDICGKEIGLLGNRKCKDGDLCKQCAGKLSPWFRGRKKTSIAKIQEQLDYRKANKKRVQTFSVSRSYGTGYKILVDDNQKAFMVTSRDNWRDANPDVVDMKDLKSCDIIVIEHRSEQHKEDGSSYEPKRYNYEYTFNVDVIVKTPYFTSMKFELSKMGDRPTDKESDEYKALMKEARRIQEEFKDGEFRLDASDGNDIDLDDEELEDDEWKCTCGQINDSNYCSACGKPKPAGDRWFCPDCGKENHGKFCVNCGRKKPQ